MSIHKVPQDCQEIQTKIAETMALFIESVRQLGEQNGQEVALQLASEQLALFLAAWPTSTAASLAALTVFSPEKNRRLQQHILTWQQFLGIPTSWHLLQGAPSEQEREGSVTTELSVGLHHFLAGTAGHRFIIAHEDTTQALPSRQHYQERIHELHNGERISLTDIIKIFSSRGFARHTTTLEPGSFVVRGDQLEFWHPIQNPYRVTLYGNTVENIVESEGKRSRRHHKVKILPLHFPLEHSTLAESIAKLTIVRPSICTECRGTFTITYDAATSSLAFPLSPQDGITQRAFSHPTFFIARNLDRVKQYIQAHTRNEQTQVCIHSVSDIPLAWQGETYALVTEASLFTDQAQDTHTISYTEGLQIIAELKEGRPAVHSDHGIGIYEGLQSRTINGVTREYIVLRYADAATLSVPVELAYKVTAYLGETAPTIHKLGGTLWIRTARKAKKDAAIFAQDLLATAHSRQQSTRDNFYIDPALEEKLAASFPYTLTEGQANAWIEVQRDLQRATPMDRLIVGDVGFGKTEIAIRAAVHAAANGRQVAIVAPTTLLVQQHFDTFTRRLPDRQAGLRTDKDSLPLLTPNLTMLSRFISPSQQKAAREAIVTGNSLIAVGTHALLSRSVQWKNLGLVIIDEEQRFGVIHKEHFKKLRASVDMLSLSATPIPRTLSMALTGLKSLSIISSPPSGRRDIKSYVGKDNDAIIQQAITQELARGGQVYVVLPRIQGLAAMAGRLSTLIPNVRIAIAHGQMPSITLAHIMHEFDQGNIKILVSSTIIENGLDLPNANTLIVHHATHFGLSELYQLRGRIGRRTRQGYTYFLYQATELTGIQRRRLAVLTETSRLGSGWALAQRDLELRGAGNLLGAEQSGAVNAVGIQLYLDMVREVITNEEMGTPPRPEVEVQVPFPTYIPSHYIADLTARLRYYQQLSRSRTEQDTDRLVQNIVRTYGQSPEEFTNLVCVLKLQLIAGQETISKISYRAVTPSDESPYSRLLIESTDVLRVLSKVAVLGNWVVRGQIIQRDVTAITPTLIKELTEVLAKKVDRQRAFDVG